MKLSISKGIQEKSSQIIKFALIIIFAVYIIRLLVPTLDNYAQTKVFEYSSTPATEGNTYDLVDGIQQQVIAKGNRLSNLSVYIGDNPYVKKENGNITLSILSGDKHIFNKVISASDLVPNSWNEMSVNADGLKRNSTYTIMLQSDVSGIITFTGSGNSDSKYMVTTDADNYALGFSYTYEYYTLGHALLLFFNIMYSVFIIVAATYTIIKVKNWKSIYNHPDINKSVPYALVLAISILFMFNPMTKDNTEVKQFLRVQGAGIMDNYDVTRVINNFTLWIIGFVIVLLLMLAFITTVKEVASTKETAAVWHYFDDFIIIAIVNYVLRAITFFSDNTTAKITFYYSSNLISLILLALFAYLLLRLYKKMSFEKYNLCLISLLCLCVPVAAILHTEWESGILLFGLQFVAILLLICIIRFVALPEKLLKNGTMQFCIFGFAGIQPLILSLYIEFINVLNQHKVFVKRVGKYYGVGQIVLLLIFVCIYFLLKKKNIKTNVSNKIVYPTLVAGVAALSIQIPLTTTYSAHLFESANSSILISDFLNFGKVPIVEHYGGHMMSGVWEGILYGLVNNDRAGAIFSPYSGLIVIVISLVFYYLISKIWNEDASLLTTLFFPFYGITSIYIQGALIALAAAVYVRKNTTFRAVLLWIACAWCTLYRLDLGFAFDFAVVIALGLYVLTEKNKKAIKQLIITLFSVLICFGIAWVVICVLHNTNPISRLLEFVRLSASNQNWAYNNIGNNGLAAYSWGYIFIPMITAMLLTYSILSKKLRSKVGNEKWVILLCVGFSYFFNFPRGLVRHSLAEMSLTIVIWTAYLFISIFAALKIEKKVFLPALTGFALLNSLFAGNGNFVSSPIADSAFSRIDPMVDSWHLSRFAYDDAPDDEEPKTYWKELQGDQKVVNRAEWNDTLKTQIIPVQTLMDALLKENETFVDFTNVTFMYSALNRLNPVYISQSPLQLSGEYTQEQFINEIAREPEKNPILLMPHYNNMRDAGIVLDGIANNYRNYLVAEYLYQNYRPLCGYGEFAIWCLQDRYDELKNAALDFSKQIDYTDAIVTSEEPYAFGGCDLTVGEEGIRMIANSSDPKWNNFGDYINIPDYGWNTIKITIDYDTDTEGILQLFYTNDEDEEHYSEDKSAKENIRKGSGRVSFEVTVNEYSRMRLDTPPNSNVLIKGVKVGYASELLNYGYDRHMSENRIVDSTSLHIYGLNYLPIVWGETDELKASDNEVQSEINDMGEYYQIDSSDSINKTEGNYLKISAEYHGYDMNPNEDDESTGATVRIGTIVNGEFVEKYRYTMTFVEGTHDYLIRLSNDYSWYSSDIDAIQLDCSQQLYDVNMSILKGD